MSDRGGRWACRRRTLARGTRPWRRDAARSAWQGNRGSNRSIRWVQVVDALFLAPYIRTVPQLDRVLLMLALGSTCAMPACAAHLSLEQMARLRPPSSTINMLQLCRAYSSAGASELGITANVACSLPPWWWQRLNIHSTTARHASLHSTDQWQSAGSKPKEEKKSH
jgi:hypothetical protein